MALLQSALVEPLLSRQQTAVIRDIARAAQLNEALIALGKIPTTVADERGNPRNIANVQELTNYLKAEITRVLMQIKIPAASVKDIKADTNVPGKIQ